MSAIHDHDNYTRPTTMKWLADERIYPIYGSLLSLLVVLVQVTWNRWSPRKSDEDHYWLPTSQQTAFRKLIHSTCAIASFTQVLLVAISSVALDGLNVRIALILTLVRIIISNTPIVECL